MSGGVTGQVREFVRAYPGLAVAELLALGYRVQDAQGRELEVDLVDVHGVPVLRAVRRDEPWQV